MTRRRRSLRSPRRHEPNRIDARAVAALGRAAVLVSLIIFGGLGLLVLIFAWWMDLGG